MFTVMDSTHFMYILEYYILGVILVLLVPVLVSRFRFVRLWCHGMHARCSMGVCGLDLFSNLCAGTILFSGIVPLVVVVLLLFVCPLWNCLFC